MLNVFRLCLTEVGRFSFSGTHRSEICTHVITDRQWLIENCLCLLSNAVKFSSSGNVIMKINLVNTTDKIDRISDQRLSFIVKVSDGCRIVLRLWCMVLMPVMNLC